jgi:riboflavin synthase
MFTGIIETMGQVTALTRRGGDARLEMAANWPSDDLPGVALGDSVSINGTCLTVVAFDVHGAKVRMQFDASHETLTCTSLGALRAGVPCNLERALQVGGRLGGHWVTGHVDATGRLTRINKRGEAWDLEYSLPADLEPEVVAKGSVAIDGVSLTVNRVWAEHFGVTIIPHTEANTQLLQGGVGKVVNLETDLLAKYIRRMMRFDGQPGADSGVNEELLKRAGFQQ